MYNIGVIGCGNRIRRLLCTLRDVNDSFRVSCVYDVSDDSISRLKEDFGDDIKVCSDFSSLIESPDVDWVMIGSYNLVHKEQVIATIRAGKNVFAEKPLAVSVEECREIKDVYDENPVKFLISYPLRYAHHYKKIKEIIDSGEIGEIVSLEFNEVLEFEHGSAIMANWRRHDKNSGGHLLEKCCHDIDLVNSFVNSLPKKAASFGGIDMFLEKNIELFDNVKNKDYYVQNDEKLNSFTTEKDCADNQVVIIEFNNGVRATFHTNISSAIPERRVYICGTKGTIRADVLNGEIEVNFIDPERGGKSFYKNMPKENHWGGDVDLMRSFDMAMRGDRIPTATMDDAVKSCVSAIMIDKARRENKIIDLTETWKNFGY